VQLEIRPDPAEVGRARRWARSRLAGSGIGADEPLAETLVLLVSELVTNAVVHTGRPAVLRLSMPDVCRSMPDAATAPTAGERGAGAAGVAGTVGTAGEVGEVGAAGAVGSVASVSAVSAVIATVRLEVVDASTWAPRPRCADGDDTNGRGLALVDGLADRWGWSPEGAGKRIWCEVDRCSSTAAAVAAATAAKACDASQTAAYGDLTYEAV